LILDFGFWIADLLNRFALSFIHFGFWIAVEVYPGMMEYWNAGISGLAE